MPGPGPSMSQQGPCLEVLICLFLKLHHLKLTTSDIWNLSTKSVNNAGLRRRQVVYCLVAAQPMLGSASWPGILSLGSTVTVHHNFQLKSYQRQPCGSYAQIINDYRTAELQWLLNNTAYQR